MLGAIIGDVVGSRFEFDPVKPGKDFELITEESTFTDDTILTIAVMDWLLHAKIRDSYSLVKYFQKWGRKYDSSYGTNFRKWLYSDNPKPYHSKGNGNGMRVSPVAYASYSIETVLSLSDLVTGITHDSPEGIKGARLIAQATFMARCRDSKEDIRDMAIKMYPEIAKMDYDDLVKNYTFSELSENTCPQAVYCFLISKDFEDCLRISVSIGGDTDTLCAMSMAIAYAYYGKNNVPYNLIKKVMDKLPEDMVKVIDDFYEGYEYIEAPIISIK